MFGDSPVHNVLYVQFEFLPTKQAVTYLKFFGPQGPLDSCSLVLPLVDPQLKHFLWIHTHWNTWHTHCISISKARQIFGLGLIKISCLVFKQIFTLSSWSPTDPFITSKVWGWVFFWRSLVIYKLRWARSKRLYRAASEVSLLAYLGDNGAR